MWHHDREDIVGTFEDLKKEFELLCVGMKVCRKKAAPEGFKKVLIKAEERVKQMINTIEELKTMIRDWGKEKTNGDS